MRNETIARPFGHRSDLILNTPRRWARSAQRTHAAVVDTLESRQLLSTYYVSTSGSDSGGGSATAPWKTLQKAANAVVAGDTVHVGSGSYNAGMNLYGRSGGTASAPITFVADSGATITHSATSGTNASLAAINIENAGNYYVIQGFNIQSDGSMQRAGIRVSGSNNVSVVNNTINKAFIGIFASNTNNLTLTGNVASNSTDQHGIYVGAGTRNSIIRGNTMFGNNYDGLHMNASNAAGPNDGALVEDNVSYGNNLSGVDAEGITNAVFRNNVIYDNARHGVTIHSQDQTANGDPTPPSANNVFVNNTIATSSGSTGSAIQIRASDIAETIYNNILINQGSTGYTIGLAPDSGGGTVSTSGLHSDYNIVVDRFTRDTGTSKITLAQWRTATGLDTHSVLVSNVSSLFTSLSAHNFHLANGSVAIDAGAGSYNGSTAPTADFDAKARPAGNAIDIGAFESGSSSTPPDTTAPTVSGVASSNVTTSGASVNWTTNEASDTQIEYGLTTSYGSSTTLNTALVTSHSGTLSSLNAGAVYHYRVKSRDAAGNLATSSDFTFTTTAVTPPDTTAPTTSNVATSNVTKTGATVSWTTNEASDTQIEYGLTASYGSSTTLNTALVTSHSGTLSGLTAGTVYHYRVKSRDAAGNLGTSSDFTFTTTASTPVDTTPPSVNGIVFDPSVAQAAVVTFSENVGVSLASGDFSLTNATTGTPVGVTLASVSPDGTTATLTFNNTGGVTDYVLATGSYVLKVNAGMVGDTSNNMLLSTVQKTISFTNADFNLDGSVNFADLLAIARGYTTASGATFGEGDANYDGRVDFSDLLILARNYADTTTAAPASATSTSFQLSSMPTRRHAREATSGA